MRKGLVTLLSMVVTAMLGVEVIHACGDKFLLVGRGVRFQRAYAAIYPASILIYARPAQGAATAIRDPRLQSSLKAAGHVLSTVDTQSGLERALTSGQYDLVLGDVADAAMLEAQAQTAPLRPTVLFVMYKPDKQEAEALKQKYNCPVLMASDKTEKYLMVIDDTMKARMKEGRGKARKGT